MSGQRRLRLGASSEAAGACSQPVGGRDRIRSGPPTAEFGFQHKTAAVARVSATVPHGLPLSMNKLALKKLGGLPIKGGLM